MQTRFWLIMASIALSAGCVPANYSAGQGYSEAVPAYYQRTPGLYQNPETQYQQEIRIWRGESGR
jgi:hypothetical protein